MIVNYITGGGNADISALEAVTARLEEAVGVYSTAQPLPATYFNITNGEIRGFSQLGLDAYNNDEITDLILPSSYSLDGQGNVIDGNDYNITSIGNSAFGGYGVLTSITIPSSVTSIENNAFASCYSLTGVLNIPSGVTSIGSQAFNNCSGLTSIEISNSVTSIGQSAFYGCSGLTGTLTIPSSVTSIDGGAFRGCSGLTSITIEAIIPPTLGNNVFYDTNDCPIYVPSASVSAYQTAWSQYASRIQAEVE